MMRPASTTKVLLFNPRATRYKARIPNSILQIAASIDGKHAYAIVDGNLEEDPWQALLQYLETGDYRYFALSVMPGPQLKQAIPFSKRQNNYFPALPSSGVVTLHPISRK
jgi:anaerobic magnesium-protoporphyrin IX monomethyl ester cyclase